MFDFKRLQKLMDDNKITQQELANKLGLTQGAIADWKARNVMPKADVALKVARLFNVSVEYLVEGTGEGKDGKPVYIHGSTVEGNNIIPFSPGQNTNIVYIPFYEDIKASAGSGTEAEDYTQPEAVPILRNFIGQYNPKTVRMLEVNGDSMNEVNLFSGDLVFFVPTDNPANGLYVIGIEDKLFVKRLEFDILGQEIKVISENNRYSTQILKGDDMNRLRIIGKVIGWVHRHPY
jgi:phage repressor protein C with HTH and peptisase S24 domain